MLGICQEKNVDIMIFSIDRLKLLFFIDVMGKTFGEYIAEQRLKAGLDQIEVFGEKSQGYISSIENNKRIPKSRKGIENLASALKMKTTPKFIDWLWAYALFGDDPIEYFNTSFHGEKPKTNDSMNGNNEITISIDASEQDIIARLGQPDYKFVVAGTRKNKWIYEKEGIHIIFANGKVQDVIFK